MMAGKSWALAAGLALAASLAAPARAQGGADPLMGKWNFAGADAAGVAWRGTLIIGEIDPSRFSPNPDKYNHMCQIDLESANSGRGRETPCLYNPQTRELSFSGGTSTKYSYSASLSPDGKSLTRGRWTEGASETGTWSARSSNAAADSAPARTSAPPAAPRPTPLAKMTAVTLKATEVPYDGPCGKKLEVTATLATDGPARVWYRFYANIGSVEFSGGQNGTIEIASGGDATIGKDATFTRNLSGELRIQAAAQNAEGRHASVTISNVVPFHVTCVAK